MSLAPLTGCFDQSTRCDTSGHPMILGSLLQWHLRTHIPCWADRQPFRVASTTVPKPHSSPAIVKAWACSVLSAIAVGQVARPIWGSCTLPCRRPGQLQAGRAPIASTAQAPAGLLGQAQEPAKHRHMLKACRHACGNRRAGQACCLAIQAQVQASLVQAAENTCCPKACH